VDPDAARGQLAFSTMLGLMLNPHIIHVVAYSEAQYAAGAKEIIESVKMVNHIIKKYQKGFPAEMLLSNPRIESQKKRLKNEAMAILETIKKIGKGYDDPLVEPNVLEKAVEIGILDAPDLQGNKVAKGEITTAIIDGACVAIDSKTGNLLPEQERLEKILTSTYPKGEEQDEES
jgi:hypothetical protein